MDRVKNIMDYAQRKSEERVRAQEAKALEIQSYKDRVCSLEPRIAEMLRVANACVAHGIPLPYNHTHNQSNDYEAGYFIADSIRHRLGFIPSNSLIKYVGIMGGGYCEYNLETNGDEIRVRGDEAGVLKRFLAEFDRFESMFYKYVDATTKQ